ncbi:MAG: DUF1523 family protein [Pseudomonadota bacterium]
MAYVRWTIRILFFAFVVAFLHYTLPQRDLVRVADTEIIRKDYSGWTRIFYAQPDTGDLEQPTRDLRLINTVRGNGRVSVYRNEDTGFGWPPYFKLDSANLQAEAADAVSTREAPEWYMIRHYGWRSPFLSIYPNGITIKPAAGPKWSDHPWYVQVPWFNLAVILFLIAVYWAIAVRVKRFRENRIDPLFADDDEV